jgi:hypothetical protein
MGLFEVFTESQRVSIQPYEPRFHEPTGEWFAYRKPRPFSDVTEWVGPMTTETECRAFCDSANLALAEFAQTASKEILEGIGAGLDVSVHVMPGSDFSRIPMPSRFVVTFDGSQPIKEMQEKANRIIQDERARLNAIMGIHGL